MVISMLQRTDWSCWGAAARYNERHDKSKHSHANERDGDDDDENDEDMPEWAREQEDNFSDDESSRDYIRDAQAAEKKQQRRSHDDDDGEEDDEPVHHKHRAGLVTKPAKVDKPAKVEKAADKPAKVAVKVEKPSAAGVSAPSKYGAHFIRSNVAARCSHTETTGRKRKLDSLDTTEPSAKRQSKAKP